MKSSQRPLSRRQSRTGLSQLNQSLQTDFFSTDNRKYAARSKLENDHLRKDYPSDSLPNKPSITKPSRRRENSYHHSTPKAQSRCQSFTDIRESTSSKGTIEICLGDITKHTVDAIIVASTSDLLTENVLKEAGNSVRAVYEKELQRKPNTTICTDGGYLACQRIYFVPCPQLSKNPDKWVVQKFVSEAIELARNDRFTSIHSIAFPAIGCGKYGCDLNFIANTLITAVVYELEQRPSLQLRVCFVIQQHEQKIYDAFRNELKARKNNASTCQIINSQSSDTPVLSGARCLQPQQHENQFVVGKRRLSESSTEYTRVTNEFRSTMTSNFCSEILRIELVWNERWYRQYMIHKEEFFRRLQSNTERYLFHGCSETAANSIIQQCFDRGHAGIHGTSYGHGVYFSSRANYSHLFATANAKGERCMFLAKVLVGKTIKGDPSMKYCPAGYDTTTDGSHICVIYHDVQAFGYYLITYK